MKVKPMTKVESNLDDFQFGYWDADANDGGGKFAPVDGDAKAQTAMAKAMGCSPELVDTLEMLFSELAEKLWLDLRDLALEVYELRQRLDQ